MERFSNPKSIPPTLPFNMISYITKIPPQKDETQWKLMKVCKFFYAKHLIIPVADFYQSHINSMVSVYSLDNKKSLKRIPVLHQLYKLWICNNFSFVYRPEYNSLELSMILPYVYRCDFKELFLENVLLTFGEWKFLLSSKFIEQVELEDVVITDEDGTELAVEDILNTMPQTLVHLDM